MLTLKERLKARDRRLRELRKQRKSDEWINGWLRGWNNPGFKRLER